jgi:hypothetical protein
VTVGGSLFTVSDKVRSLGGAADSIGNFGWIEGPLDPRHPD